MSFPREDMSSPRLKILNEFCPKQLGAFKHCLEQNNNDENKCPNEKKKLNKCSAKAFRKINNDLAYVF